jgi:hypothetical protein
MPTRYNLSDVLGIWDEIPEDDQVTDESSSDDDHDSGDDYTPDEPCSGSDALAKDQIQLGEEIDSCGTQDCSNTTTTSTRKPNGGGGGKKASSTQKKDKLVEQVHFMVINDHPYPLSADQVKHLQKEISSKLKENLCVAQVKKIS